MRRKAHAIKSSDERGNVHAKTYHGKINTATWLHFLPELCLGEEMQRFLSAEVVHASPQRYKKNRRKNDQL